MKYALPAIVAALLTAGCASTCPQAEVTPPAQTEAPTEAERVAMLKDIPLLGHMFKHDTEKTVEVAEPNGVPLLADIPIIGHLFKRTDKPAETPEDPGESGE